MHKIYQYFYTVSHKVNKSLFLFTRQGNSLSPGDPMFSQYQLLHSFDSFEACTNVRAVPYQVQFLVAI